VRRTFGLVVRPSVVGRFAKWMSNLTFVSSPSFLFGLDLVTCFSKIGDDKVMGCRFNDLVIQSCEFYLPRNLSLAATVMFTFFHALFLVALVVELRALCL
jgi:hypothetical protein